MNGVMLYPLLYQTCYYLPGFIEGESYDIITVASGCEANIYIYFGLSVPLVC